MQVVLECERMCNITRGIDRNIEKRCVLSCCCARLLFQEKSDAEKAKTGNFKIAFSPLKKYGGPKTARRSSSECAFISSYTYPYHCYKYQFPFHLVPLVVGTHPPLRVISAVRLLARDTQDTSQCFLVDDTILVFRSTTFLPPNLDTSSNSFALYVFLDCVCV